MLLKRKLRVDGIVEVPMLVEEERQKHSAEFKAIVAEWPIERIANLESTVGLPRSRVVALLGIGQSAFGSICTGAYTPSPALCRRMQQLVEMHERGELHRQFVPEKSDMQRRMTLFRAWWFARPPEREFPLVSVSIKVKWGKSRCHEVIVPVDVLPSLRLTKLDGLVQVVKAITIAVKTLARDNSRLMWKQVDEEYWHRYSRETLPAIIEERVKKKS